MATANFTTVFAGIWIVSPVAGTTRDVLQRSIAVGGLPLILLDTAGLRENTDGDEIEQVVAWKSGSNLSRLVGKPTRLRFVMKDADLYAFQFSW